MTDPATHLGDEIARLARQWAAAAVPYVHRGTDRRGCDCTGLIIGIVRELSFLGDYELRYYPPDWNLHGGAGNQVIEELERFAARIDGRTEPGDIAVMRFGKCPAHAGILVGDDLMVHCHRDAKRCLYAKMQSSPWSKRWLCTYRATEEKLSAFGK